ncbi:hypothetical protein OO185_00020 [Prosthecochloris sp. SCSIO W1102]|uniref:hypothetical protein n=1 Tax=Prosthecochloris sp. SCSIO W1102 TaxID=2992243 RepID=UPI00223E2B9E|nr:hypothetical protein [Prosthecochloris sp. SCSIO W1102]UZJ39525.1 hypothetical protein OO185_00020 [Prosthecochloris sp. SCSIO W1102]
MKLLNLQNGQAAGLTGFGASAHLVLKLMRFLYPDSAIHVFARSPQEREFALSLGAEWAGDTADTSPNRLQGLSIQHLSGFRYFLQWRTSTFRPSGDKRDPKRVEDQDVLMRLDYARHLWMEKEMKSVANVTAGDVREFLAIAEKMKMRPEVQLYPFEEANKALTDIKRGGSRGEGSAG